MRVYTPARYIGTGLVVTLASILGINQCLWFRVQPISNGALNGRVGDANIASGARGFPLGVDVEAEPGFFAAPVLSTPQVTESYDLTKWYIVLSNGDTASIGAAT